MLKNGITHENNGFDITEISKDKLREANEIYICPSFLCNLNCPHCTLKNLPTQLELERIEQTLEYINKNSGNKVLYDLFGGEPLLLQDFVLERLYKKISQKQFVISTNLLNLRDSIIPIFKEAKWINTSWNPRRFDIVQSQIWQENINILHKNDIKINLMITLTPDLLIGLSPVEFIKFISIFKPYSLDLDYVIGEDFTAKRLAEIDNWLCGLYTHWDIPTKFDIADNIKNSILTGKKYRDCSNHYTILPSGNIKPGCAYYETDVDKSNCLYCEYYPWCNGACRLQKDCTFPKRLFRIIERELCEMD